MKRPLIGDEPNLGQGQRDSAVSAGVTTARSAKKAGCWWSQTMAKSLWYRLSSSVWSQKFHH